MRGLAVPTREAASWAVRGGPESLTNVNTPEDLAAVGGRFGEPEP